MANPNVALRMTIVFMTAFGGPLSLVARAQEMDSAYSARVRSRSELVAYGATADRLDMSYSAWARQSTPARGARGVAQVASAAPARRGGGLVYSAVASNRNRGLVASSGAFSATAVDRGLVADVGLIQRSSFESASFGSLSSVAREPEWYGGDRWAQAADPEVVPVVQESDTIQVDEESEDALPPEPNFAPPQAIGGQDDAIAIPDRWRLVETLKVKKENILDPYNQNTLKADRPIYGKDWFLNLLLISDSTAEFRRLPTPVGNQADLGPRTDPFGDGEQSTFQQNFITSISLIKGNTTFRPPDYEFRFTGVTNFNYSTADVAGLLNVDPSDDDGQKRRYDQHFGVQELFIDKHLRNKSDRYDFDSLRVGIQPFISDFRGFIFQDQQPGVRLFGNFINNRIQYNLAYFRRLNKDTNSGLNEFELRDDELYIANLYYQDFPVLGFQLQGTVIHNKNREGDRRRRFDENNALVRPAAVGNQLPHNYDVTYFGINGDGHFDRLNLTFAAYQALGTDERNQIADRSVDINAVFTAAEASVDFDWYRVKAYGLYTSGDKDPFDSKGEGFDAIFENPQFAGADTSFYQRQAIPFVGGGRVALSGRNSLIPSLRSSKEEGQSNFVNPGLRMVGVGADFDILPELRLIMNASYLDFDKTSSLRALRTQGRIPRHLGEDLSAAIVYRPLFINNILVRLSAAALIPGDGFEALFDDRGDDVQYSLFANVVLTY
jgi:hypothetical protein